MIVLQIRKRRGVENVAKKTVYIPKQSVRKFVSAQRKPRKFGTPTKQQAQTIVEQPQYIREELEFLGSIVNSESYRSKVNAMPPAFTFRRP